METVQAGPEGLAVHDFKHILRVFATSFAETFWPTRCAGCDMPGGVLCPDCAADLPFIDPYTACPTCGAPFGALACTECAHFREQSRFRQDTSANDATAHFAFEAARCAVSYEGLGKRVLTTYKDHDEARLAAHIAACMLRTMHGSSAMDGAGMFGPLKLQDWTHWADALVAVPPSAAALKRRGYDHMQLIAQELEHKTGIPLYHPLVVTRKTADQRHLGSDDRAKNLMGAIQPAPDAFAAPNVLLIDDVLTTGATCNAAARALLACGAEHVRVVTFARVW